MRIDSAVSQPHTQTPRASRYSHLPGYLARYGAIRYAAEKSKSAAMSTSRSDDSRYLETADEVRCSAPPHMLLWGQNTHATVFIHPP